MKNLTNYFEHGGATRSQILSADSFEIARYLTRMKL